MHALVHTCVRIICEHERKHGHGISMYTCMKRYMRMCMYVHRHVYIVCVHLHVHLRIRVQPIYTIYAWKW